jgi:16S rRNA (uracil1498-N3)-methyltransferase
MESFLVDPKNIRNGLAKIEGEEYHHLAHSLRKRVGERILLFDGSGKVYTATITKITKEYAECEIIDESFMLGEIEAEIAVAQAILKNTDRFEFAIEKLTEIGVKRIIPLITSRVISPKSKTDRWRKIILSACKQSNRAIIPEIDEPVEFDEFLEISSEFEIKIIFHESESMEFKRSFLFDHLKKIENANSIILAVGPEGGFTEDEISKAVGFGFEVISLGQRRLRSETASIVGAGVIAQFIFANLKRKEIENCRK